MEKWGVNNIILINDYIKKFNEIFCADTIVRTQTVCVELLFYIVGRNLHDDVQMDLVSF